MPFSSEAKSILKKYFLAWLDDPDPDPSPFRHRVPTARTNNVWLQDHAVNEVLATVLSLYFTCDVMRKEEDEYSQVTRKGREMR